MNKSKKRIIIPFILVTLFDFLFIFFSASLLMGLIYINSLAGKQKNTYGTRASETRLSPRGFAPIGNYLYSKISPLVDEPNLYSVAVYGGSAGKNVDGYDVLISYDSEKIKPLDLEGVVEDFSTYHFFRKSHISVTSYRKLDHKQSTAFENTKLFVLKVRSLNKLKENDLQIIYKKHPQTTKFINEDVEVIIPTILPQSLL